MSTSNTVSPLRQRMIEDMTARNLGHHTQRSHTGRAYHYEWMDRIFAPLFAKSSRRDRDVHDCALCLLAGHSKVAT
jgi:hypothetical protein